MALKRTVASKEGGYDVECTPEEEAAFRAEWAKNDVARAKVEYLRLRKSEYPKQEELDKAMWEHIARGNSAPMRELDALMRAIDEKYPPPIA